MHESTRNAQELYDEFPFGEFCYGSERTSYYPLLDEFLSRIGPKDTLADVGCGAGFWMDAYLARGIPRANITAVDLAPSNVERLKARGFEAFVGDVTRLDFPDGAFAFTICAGVIHHAPDPARAFSELVRVTKPGGAIYVSVYNKWHPYFYVVHKATFPLRYAYWNVNRRVADWVYPLWKLATQPAARVALGRFLDDRTCRTLFMDQVMTPHAHLFSRRDLESYAAAHGAKVSKVGPALKRLMLAAIVDVGAMQNHA